MLRVLLLLISSGCSPSASCFILPGSRDGVRVPGMVCNGGSLHSCRLRGCPGRGRTSSGEGHRAVCRRCTTWKRRRFWHVRSREVTGVADAPLLFLRPPCSGKPLGRCKHVTGCPHLVAIEIVDRANSDQSRPWDRLELGSSIAGEVRFRTRVRCLFPPPCHQISDPD